MTRVRELHHQLRRRREALGLRQKDMTLRVGMSRQQYQHLEAGGNPRLETLELVAKGLNMTLMLVPQEKRQAVRALLEQTEPANGEGDNQPKGPARQPALSDDPWQDVLKDE